MRERPGAPRLVVDLTALRTPGGVRGIGRYIRELALGLSELPAAELGGIELVGLLSVGWNGEHQVTRDFASVGADPRGAPPTGADYYAWAYRQRVAMFRALRRLGARGVHITDPHATPLLLNVFGVRKLVTCHDLVPTRFPEHYMSHKDGGPVVGKWIERRRYRSARLVLAVSDATRNDVISLLGVPAERCVRVYNGADVQRWATPPLVEKAPVLRRLGLHERPFVLYAGGADYRKNAEGMIGGLLRARARGTALTLAWAGNLEPSQVTKIRTLLAAHDAADAVRLLGFVTDTELAVLYRNALAHLFVSRLEGFGFTAVEAMASGCPVVTTRGGSLGEIAGGAALHVDPEDHAAIGDTLHRLAQDPGLRGALAAKGRARASRFSRIEQARGTLALYRALLA